MEKIIREFTAHLYQLGYAESSIKTKHQTNVKEFVGFVKRFGITEWYKVESFHIEGYLSYLGNRPNKVLGGKLSEQTIYNHYRSLELLYNLLEEKGIVSINPLSKVVVKSPRRNTRKITVTEEEIRQIYGVCNDGKERAILSLAYGCGLRVGEIERLEINDIKLNDGYLIVRRGKGNKRRAIPMSNKVVYDLRSYLQTERPRLRVEKHYDRNNQTVLLNDLGRSMREWTINKRLRGMAKRTNNPSLINKKISTHVLRHSIATHLLARGLDINQVRIFLGHVLLTTTQIYTHIENKQVLQI